ncbi:efflux RND transporter periplasmic adaptor subunit [Bacillus songklensis]|uniref:Efflux RND transporter periplasmic adaptor subunit n=1 Tax=Bacillus songklensis TaxID=1069116 RepID=A0ABV8BBI8_9BACI
MEEQQAQTVSEKRFSKKWTVMVVVASFIIAAAGGVMAAKITSHDDLQFVNIEKPKPNEKNTLGGKVAASDTKTFYLDPSKGNIQTVFVKEGQAVKKGEKLFEYEHENLEGQLKKNAMEQRMAQLSSEQAQKAIDSLQEEMDTLEGEEALDTDMKMVVLSQEVAEQESKKQIADLQLEKAKLEQESLEKQKQNLTIYSSMDGTVGRIDFGDAEAGQDKKDESASKNERPIMTIYSNGPYQIQGTLTELQKNEIQSGLPIKVKAKAVPGQTWDGHILAVSDYPTTDDPDKVNGNAKPSKAAVSSYAFRAQLDQHENLFPGYHVTVHVELPSEMEIAIPRSSVIKKGDTTYVYVVEKGKLKKREISVEVKNKKAYRVLEGLKHGDTILKNPSSEVRSGMKVETK